MFPRRKVSSTPLDAGKAASWEKLLAVRTEVMRALEAARNAKTISGALEAKVFLSAGSDLAPLLEQYQTLLPSFFIVSQVEIAGSASADAQKSGDDAGTQRFSTTRRRREVRTLLELFHACRRKRRLPDRVRTLREGLDEIEQSGGVIRQLRPRPDEPFGRD